MVNFFFLTKKQHVLGAVEKTLKFYLMFALFFSQSWFQERRMMDDGFTRALGPESWAWIPASRWSVVGSSWVTQLLGFFICNIGHYHLQYTMMSSRFNSEIKHLAHRRHSSKIGSFCSSSGLMLLLFSYSLSQSQSSFKMAVFFL